jgi:hypothetical protein
MYDGEPFKPRVALHHLKRYILIGVLLLAAAGVLPTVEAQEISTLGGNPTLNITTGTAGSEPIPVVNTSVTLSYNKQKAVSKITVQTSCIGQRFTLKVLATGVSGGVAAPEVTLINGMPATDFIRDIATTGPKNRSATLQYTASATFSQGNSADLGNDVHTVTYTILAQ